MVQRRFAAFDNEAFTVDPSSPNLDAGSPIINDSSTPEGTIFSFTSGFAFQTIIVEDTSDDPDTFNDDKEDDHIIVDGSGLVANGTPVESESFHFFRALDENGNPTGDVITINVYSKNGNTSDVWGMSADAQLQEGVRYVKTGGSIRGDSLYESFVPCFTTGSVIVTQSGRVPIKDLTTDHRVLTRDNGFQPVRWIGAKDLAPRDLHQNSRLRPILIAKDALGAGHPNRDMCVSPNHRMLITDPRLSLYFGETETLVAAKHLVGLPGITMAPLGPTRYLHLLCDAHEVVSVDGTWTESFQPGEYAMTGLGKDQAEEIFALFPDLKGKDLNVGMKAARSTLYGYEANVLREVLPAR